ACILFLRRALWSPLVPYTTLFRSLRDVPEVVRLFCATANPVQVIVAESEQGRGILGVIDGSSPKGVENDDDIAWRREFLRKIGRSEEHTSELQSRENLVCRLLLEK